MPSTAVHALRYPVLGDSPNVPLDLQRLADDVERELNEHDARLTPLEARHYATLRPSAAQSIGNNTDVVITYGTNEGSSGVTVNLGAGTVTVTKAGVYAVTGSINFVANATGFRAATINVNALTVAGQFQPAFTGGYNVCSVSWIGSLNVGDVITMEAVQNSGAALNTGPVDRTHLGVAFIA